MGPSKSKQFLLIATALGFLSFQFLQMPKASRAQRRPMLVTSTAVTGSTEIKEAKPDVSHKKWMADMEAKYKKANKRIQKYCKVNLNDLQGHLSTSALQKLVVRQYKSKIYFDQNHRIALCQQGKVGTATWASHFLKLAKHPGNFDSQSGKVHKTGLFLEHMISHFCLFSGELRNIFVYRRHECANPKKTHLSFYFQAKALFYSPCIFNHGLFYGD